MRFIVLSLIVLCLCIEFSVSDRVEDVQNEVNALINNAQDTLTLAKTERTNLDNARKQVYSETSKMRGDLHNKRKSEESENTELRKHFENRTSINKIQEGLDQLAKTESEKVVQDFKNTTLKEFENFLKGKQENFRRQVEGLEDSWGNILDVDKWIEETKSKLSTATLGDADVDRLKKELHLIARQVQLQQFNEEEKVRSDGNSGVKQIRTRNSGDKNYFTNTYTGRSICAIHDHANNIRTLGMGEFIGVLNGVEFRTRHNDYRLKMAVRDNTEFHATQDIPFPDVPPAVLNKTNISEEIEEMRMWFKAFHEQDHSVRDYRKYFKPVLCYLEGAWTTKSGESIDEPFESDRHHIDATSWFDLQEKIHFTSYSGTKSVLENLAHLPTTIMDFKDGKPIFAQWNYRILCHPLSKDIPTSYLQLVTDPASQKMTNRDDEQYRNSRSARFDLQGMTSDNQPKRIAWPQRKATFLDQLMEEIPGKDNYGAEIFDGGFDARILSRDGTPLNAAYYHRPYKLAANDAMGVSDATRGYSDIFWFAMTTQERIAGPSYEKEDKVTKVKSRMSIKGTYAIPLEIIYLTPLAKWNPYNIPHVDSNADVSQKGTKDNPYNNTSPKRFFRTPEAFFTGEERDVDPADTRSGGIYIKQKSGQLVKAHASGVRVQIPEIKGIDGVIRQRYPIMPIYGEGNSFWKKLNAFEDSIDLTKIEVIVKYFKTGLSTNDQVSTTHTHLLILDADDLSRLQKGEVNQLVTYTQRSNGHVHRLTLKWENNTLVAVDCDSPGSIDAVCSDHHGKVMTAL